MSRLTPILLGVFSLSIGGPGQAAERPKRLAVGEWSKPVSDAQGYALRGRLSLYEKRVNGTSREVAVYVELQDATESIQGPQLLYCDLGKNDFRPEYKGGLHCEMLDEQQRAVAPVAAAFSGAVPVSQWVTLPIDATIRLRASPFGVYRRGAKAICPYLGALWVIADDDPRAYFLSGSFTIEPSDDKKPPGVGHVWRGTIDLPRVRIMGRRQ